MAHEAKRGCGFRHVGGIYLVGDYIPVSCDRLPFKLEVCPICGAGIKVRRGMTEINALKLFGTHDQQVPVFQDNPTVAGTITKVNCFDKIRPCFMCDPADKPAYLMAVGEKYYPTPEDFLNEGIIMGFSKRIAQIPKNFKLGETIVYLAHPKACQVRLCLTSARCLKSRAVASKVADWGWAMIRRIAHGVYNPLNRLARRRTCFKLLLYCWDVLFWGLSILGLAKQTNGTSHLINSGKPTISQETWYHGFYSRHLGLVLTLRRVGGDFKLSYSLGHYFLYPSLSLGRI